MDFPVEMALPLRAAPLRGKPRTKAKAIDETRSQTDDEWSPREYCESYEALSEHVAQKLIGPVDLLDERIDLLLEDSTYQRERRRVSESLPWRVLQDSLVNQLSIDTDVDNVPTIVADRVLQGRRLELKLFRLCLRLIAGMAGQSGRIPIRAIVAPREVHPVLDFGDILPAKVRGAMIAHKISEPCGIALASGRITSTALADALVDRWLRGLNSFLALVAVMLDEDIARLGVPEEYRLDAAELTDDFMQQRKGLVVAIEQVEQSGRGYPEVYLADDEDEGDSDEEQ